MKVINQSKRAIVDFNCGIWSVENRTICFRPNRDKAYWEFATFTTEDIAFNVFNDFIDSACSDTNAFDFSKINPKGESINIIPNNQLLSKQQLLDLMSDKDKFIEYVKSIAINKEMSFAGISIEYDMFGREVIWKSIRNVNSQYSIYPFENSSNHVTYLSDKDEFCYIDDDNNDCTKDEFFLNIK